MSALFKPTVKVSMHTQTAKDTARHNDRSMYKDGYELRDLNYHYDIMGSGNSHESELDWYEKTFRTILDEQNERYEKQSKQQHMKTMKEYRLAHMPQELILQIGTHEDFESGRVDDSFCLDVIDKIVAEIERSGGVVLSWDLHNDETEDPKFVDDVSEAELKEYERDDVHGTPHLHIRFAMMSKGKINKKQALLDHEIHAPYSTMDECKQAHIEFEKSRTDISEKKKQKNIQSWEKKSAKQIEQFNNPWMTFTDNLRRVAESFAHEWCEERGLELDDENRSKRPHLEPREFRKQKEVENNKKLKEESKQLQESIAEQQVEVEQNQEQIDSSIEFAAQQYEEGLKAQEEVVLAEAKIKRAKKTVEDSNASILKANEMLSEKREEYNKLVSDIADAETTKANMIKKAQDEAEEEAKRIKEQAEMDAQEIRDNAQAEANEFLQAFDEVKESFKEFLDEGNKLELFRNPKLRAFAETMKRFLKNNVVLRFVEQVRRERVNGVDVSVSNQPSKDMGFGD